MTRNRAHDAVNRDIQTLANYDLTTFATRIHAYLELDTIPTTPDGMPTQTIGASPSTTRSPTQDADVKLTSVEAAREARTHHRDEIRAATRIAAANLAEAATHLTRATNTLDNLDQLRKHTGEVIGTQPGCRAIDRIPGAWEPVAHTTTIDGQTWPLGTWAYGFYSRQGRIPTIDECRSHLAGRHVMVKPK